MDGDSFSIKTADYRGSTSVSICDQELIGKTVTDGNLQVHISQEFFFGEIVGRNEALHLIKSCSIINLAGERAVSLAIENKMGAREAIREIEGVPFLMIYKFTR
ncbi:MAG: DUF424 domain-containing protein [Thaumarchaeota archaeon]|nr:DUF424 domain-containing protein [Nitrososphaerota archaeon]